MWLCHLCHFLVVYEYFWYGSVLDYNSTLRVRSCRMIIYLKGLKCIVLEIRLRELVSCPHINQSFLLFTISPKLYILDFTIVQPLGGNLSQRTRINC